MSAGFKHTAARVITSNRHMAATAIKGLSTFVVIYICSLLISKSSLGMHRRHVPWEVSMCVSDPKL